MKKLFLVVAICLVCSSTFAEFQFRSTRNVFGGHDYFGNNGERIRSFPNTITYGHTYYNQSLPSRTLYNVPNIINRNYSGFDLNGEFYFYKKY